METKQKLKYLQYAVFIPVWIGVILSTFINSYVFNISIAVLSTIIHVAGLIYSMYLER